MSDAGKTVQRAQAFEGFSGFLRQRKSWWLVPLAVLVILLGILYVLGHLSSADPETYPTTLEGNAAVRTVC